METEDSSPKMIGHRYKSTVLRDGTIDKDVDDDEFARDLGATNSP